MSVYGTELANLPCALKAAIGISKRTFGHPASLPRHRGRSKAYRAAGHEAQNRGGCRSRRWRGPARRRAILSWRELGLDAGRAGVGEATLLGGAAAWPLAASACAVR
jgi:hypothetical protein